MSKTNTLITKKKNMDCLLQSGKLYWSNSNCSYILKTEDKRSENLKCNFAPTMTRSGAQASLSDMNNSGGDG